MNLGFISTYDARNVRSWSGTPYFMARAMQQAGLNLEFLGPLCERLILPFRLRSLLQRRLEMRAYLWERDPLVAGAFAMEVRRRLKHSKSGLAFSPGTTAVAHLRCRQPIVFWTDMPFDASLDFYVPRASISHGSLKNGHDLEQAALRKASLAIFSSDWARNAAIANYDVDPDKVRVIPFGANINWDFDRAYVHRVIDGRSHQTCKLVFVAVDWYRKGGAFALQVAEALMRKGVPVHLTIVGCTPAVAVPEYVTVHSYIQKSDPAGLDHYRTILEDSHFLVLPSRADCTPMVIGESNSLGLPCFTTDVGGIPSLVQNGRNGQMFALSEPPDAWADRIAEVFGTQSNFSALARSSFEQYTTRLNWDTSIERFMQELRSAGLCEN